MSNSNFYQKCFIVFILFILGFIFHYKYINEFPSHIHAWAQSDRYALALGFLDNDLNFFKPQTFVYNHQFPYKWKVPSEQTITSVDFPVHDYIPALLMKLAGNTSPWLFRIYILLYSILGLFFLFRLAYAITNDYLKSILILVFTATSPVYVYYQGGFLPTIPSLSNAIIGLFFYYSHSKNNKKWDFVLCILFLTLAALSRTTFVIPLIAVLCLELLRLFKKETSIVYKIIPVSISILFLIIYQLYNGYLREKYGSIFLNHLMPPSSIEQVKEIIKYVYNNWGLQYFTKLHYLILIISLIAAVIFFIIKKASLNKSQRYFGLLIIAYFIGCVFFSLIMSKQFPAHDYYFLDTFFLPVILILTLFLSFLPSIENRNLKITSIVILCFISTGLIFQPVKSQKERRETGFWDITEATINNFENSSIFLDSLNIAKDAKILVIGAVAPNIPFIQMYRKGFVVMSTSKENIENALKWDYDYIVIQNEYFISDIYTPYPEILSKLSKMADNGKISVCTLSENKIKQSLFDFLGLNDKMPVFEKKVTFDETPDSLWENINPTTDIAYSGTKSGHLTSDLTYGLTYKTKDLPEITFSPRILMFSSYFLRDTLVNCEIVTSVNANGRNIYYKSYNLKNLIKEQNTWGNVTLMFQLPQVKSNNYEYAIFLWNTGESELYYDDFSFTIY